MLSKALAFAPRRGKKSQRGHCALSAPIAFSSYMLLVLNVWYCFWYGFYFLVLILLLVLNVGFFVRSVFLTIYVIT